MVLRTADGFAIACLFSLGTVVPALAQAPDLAAAKQRLDGLLARNYPHLDAIYKDLHAHPELAMQEVRTAGIVAARFRALRIEVTEKVGRTGVVGVLRNGSGPTIMLRSEMDALPMEEKTGLPYASHAKQMFEGQEARSRTAAGMTCTSPG